MCSVTRVIDPSSHSAYTGEGSLSPEGQKVPSPYPRVAMKTVVPRETAETTKVPEAVNKGILSRIEGNNTGTIYTCFLLHR